MAQGQGRQRKMRPKREKPEFDQQIIDLARVTRVTKGGKQMSFRVCVVIGDRKGRVGYGVEKGKDVQIAVEKAVNQAKKNMIRIPLKDETIPHRVELKYKAARVMLKPAPKGTGIIAGSVMRNVLELAGVPNASAKLIGKTKNKVTNVKATFAALSSFRPDVVAAINAKKSDSHSTGASGKKEDKKPVEKVKSKANHPSGDDQNGQKKLDEKKDA